MPPVRKQDPEETMSSHETTSHQATDLPHDPVEDVVSVIPVVLPVAGGVLMFLLAFIAIYMA
jgi:hypothetical protein